MPRTRPLTERFWEKVKRGSTDECWLWTAAKKELGYGVIGFQKKIVRAHRVSWEVANGRKVPRGKDVLHTCDNPPCVNPAHLFLGTAKDNGLDAARKNRTKQGEKHWNAKLTEADVQTIRSLYRRNQRNHQEIADRFGMSVMQIRRVFYRRSWKHI